MRITPTNAVILIEVDGKVKQIDISKERVMLFLREYAIENGDNVDVFDVEGVKFERTTSTCRNCNEPLKHPETLGGWCSVECKLNEQ